MIDNNDNLLPKMDTILHFSSSQLFYEVKIKEKNVTVKISKWKDLPDGKILSAEKGFQQNGFIYTKDEIDTTKYTLRYKILLGKGLFFWNDQNWVLVNAGEN